MTSNNPPATGIRGWLQAHVPLGFRETAYRYAAALTALLFAFGVLDSQEASLWTQLAVSTITLLFALLYATSALSAAIYTLTGPLGAILMWYGIVNEVRWALITAAVGQVFGITTAAAKTIQPGTLAVVSRPGTSPG